MFRTGEFIPRCERWLASMYAGVILCLDVNSGSYSKEATFRVLKHLKINTPQPVLAGLYFGNNLPIELYREWKIQTYGTKQLVGALSGPCLLSLNR